MAKILVTGGAVIIGSHVVDLFLSKGYETVVLDDLSTGRLSDLNPGARFYQNGLLPSHPARHIYLDAQKAAKELGWTPTLVLEQGLEKTVSYFRDTETVR